MSICDRCKNKCKFMQNNTTLDACGLFEKQTNFGRITASPEKLAEFIYCLIDACDFAAGNGAKKISQYANEDANNKRHIELVHGNLDFGELLEWLNEESKE